MLEPELAPSEGRAQSPRKGMSRMDAAKGLGTTAIKGQGRPLYAGPWSGDGARGVERSETRMSGCPSFWLLVLAGRRAEARKSDAPEGAQPKRKLNSIMSRTLGALLLLLLTTQANAFDLDQLSAQLAKPAVVRGPLIQEKHLRALPQPLTSRGQFVLSRDLGLLWQLQSPLKQDYRIDSQGIAKRTPSGWQQQPGQDVAAQQSRLFLAVLKGDHSGLAKDFQLQLSGTAEAWQLHLTPRSPMLKQIFTNIQIEGSALVERIELQETQGDRSVMLLPQSQAGDALSEQEQRDFAQ